MNGNWKSLEDFEHALTNLLSRISRSRPRSAISISKMLIVFTCLTNSQMISVSDEEEENN